MEKTDNIVWCSACVIMFVSILGLILYESSNVIYDPIEEVRAYCKEKNYSIVLEPGISKINYYCYNDDLDKLELHIRSNEFREWNRTRSS